MRTCLRAGSILRLAAGQHTLAQEPRGTLNNFIRGQGVGSSPIYDVLATGDIPSLDAGKITTGNFLIAQMPNQGALNYVLTAQGAGSNPVWQALALAQFPTITPAYGGTGQTSVPAKGEIPIGGSSILNLLGVGSNGQVLTANSGASYGVDWETPARAAASSAMRTTSSTTLAALTIASTDRPARQPIQARTSRRQ